jgi:predicted peroxiredoxin
VTTAAAQRRPKLLVKSTASDVEVERLAAALNVVGAAQAMGVPVTLWLTGDSVRIALPGEASRFVLEHGPDATAIVDALVPGGLVVCGQCAARRGIEAADLVVGAVIAGAATFVADALADDVTVLVY